MHENNTKAKIFKVDWLERKELWPHSKCVCVDVSFQPNHFVEGIQHKNIDVKFIWN
jgi:hypothetical protein